MGSRILEARGKSLSLDVPQIMGILNVTPDSFSDGGRYNSLDAAVAQAKRMVSEGASIIDIGGESTRPGADAVSTEEELARVLPVVRAIKADGCEAMISIDTSNPEVMKQCADAGAHLWNDIRALQHPEAITTAKELGVAICLMHMQGDPKTMQIAPHYNQEQGGVVQDAISFLRKRAQLCEEAGISADKIILDPGFGFGKSVEDNYDLLANIQKLTQGTSYHLLSALSRKSMIGAVTGQTVAAERIMGSVIGAFYSMQHGAHIVRVHDVKKTYEALQVYLAIKQAEERTLARV